MSNCCSCSAISRSLVQTESGIFQFSKDRLALPLPVILRFDQAMPLLDEMQPLIGETPGQPLQGERGLDTFGGYGGLCRLRSLGAGSERTTRAVPSARRVFVTASRFATDCSSPCILRRMLRLRTSSPSTSFFSGALP